MTAQVVIVIPALFLFTHLFVHFLIQPVPCVGDCAGNINCGKMVSYKHSKLLSDNRVRFLV